MSRLALVLVGMGLTGTALANPTTMAHQGRLMDGFGVPIDGPHDLSFRLYNTQIGGAIEWSETLTNVPMSDGYFSVLLGNSSPLDGAVFDGADQWLAIAVDSDPELSSRKRIAAVPYAARAASVDWSDIDGIPADIADGDDVLTEVEVEGFVTNGALDLAVGTTLDGVDIAALGNTDWSEITSIPGDLADGDDVLSEADVEGFVTNAAIDLAAGTTLDGVDIGSLGNTAWGNITSVPADIADGDDQRSEAAVEGFITNAAINLHGSSMVGGASISALGNTASWTGISGIPADIANGDQTLTENQVESFVTNGPLDLAAGTSVNGKDIVDLGGTANWTGIVGIPADIADGDAQRSEAAVEGFITNGAINLHGSSTVGGASIAGLGNTANWASISGIPADISNGDQTLTESQVEAFVTNGPVDLAAGTSVDGVDISGLGNTASWAGLSGIPADIANGDQQRSEAAVEGFITNGAINLHGSSTVGGASIAGLGNTAQWGNISGIPADISNGDQTLTESQVETFITNGTIDLFHNTTVAGTTLATLGTTAHYSNITGIPSDIADGDDERSESEVEGFITNGAINLHGSSTVGGASIAGLGNTAQWGNISGIPADISNGDQTLTESQVETFITNGTIDLFHNTTVAGTTLATLGTTAHYSNITGIPSDIADGDDERSESEVEGFITNGAINLHGSSTVGGASIAGLGNTAQWGNISGIPADISNGDQTLTESQVETFITNGTIDLFHNTTVGGTTLATLGTTAHYSNITGIPSDIADGDDERSESEVEGFITNGAINLHGSSTVGGASIAGLGNTAQWGSISGIPADIANGDQQRSEATVETYITNGAINLAGGSEVGGVDIAVITDPMVVSGEHNKSTGNLIIYPTDPSATIVPGSMTTITPTQTGHKIYAMFNTNIRTQGDEGEYCQFSMRVSGGGYSSAEFSTASAGWVASAHHTMTIAGSVTANTLAPLTVFVTVQALDGRIADPDVEPHICRVGDRTTNSMMIMELK